MSEITEGAKAPDFRLETAEGPVGLSDFADKALVLYFYPKDDTPGCTKEAQDFSALAPEFAEAGATVLGVSKDSVKKHESFARKYDLAVRLGADPDGEVIARYGSWVEKSLYGRQYMGIDRSTFLIKDGVIRRIWRKVKVANHAQQVLDAVKAL
ncbi:peroxiredoxin [Phenylobacterium sp. J367]|uniref:peroxiredoxin n=1 Tax=Phenylobacterium sp. J367 TaxID=2898435 RepID=UPI00215074DC|nr:peroxiredoxin [Phenylobacterium sp. J367]MCR5880584.1 peroxiredoxin [Phenylobacterium sp. J367]